MNQRNREIEEAREKIELAQALKRLYETSSDFRKVMKALLEDMPLEALYKASATDKQETMDYLLSVGYLKKSLDMIMIRGETAKTDFAAYLEQEMEESSDEDDL